MEKTDDKIIPIPTKEQGLRFNNDKLRWDLLEPFAVEQLVKIFSMGAKKYAPRNWQKGMPWMDVMASLKRHLNAFEKGEDYDNESGMLHVAHAAWNAMCLTSYYKIAPTFDDRPHTYLSMPKIGLDIDEVICDWVTTWCDKYGHDTPENWNFSYKNYARFNEIPKDELYDFYINIPPKINPNEIPFEPHAYITSRSVPVELTKDWIEKHKFPTAPVYSVGFGESKVNVAKESGIDVFVDDRYENFVELNKAGICTYLLTAPHNKRYEVGYKRVDSLKDLYSKFK